MTAPAPDLFNDLVSRVPVALLPVRLEVRFGTRADTSTAGVPVNLHVLRVRIYPDDISVDDHQPGLTNKEFAAGTAFWTEHERSIQDEADLDRAARQFRAWEALVTNVGQARSSYIAGACRPGGTPPLIRTGPRGAATARLLPDRWVVTGWVGGLRAFAVVSKDVAQPLAVAPAPRSDGQPMLDPNDPLLLDEGSRWLADYDAAVEAGMAVTVDLQTADEASAGNVPMARTNGIERLLAFGIRTPRADRNAQSEASDFGALLSDQLAKNGAGFLSPGTPTNNTGDRSSGWSTAPDPLGAYQRTVDPAPLQDSVTALQGDGLAAEAAAAALGVSAGIFSAFENAEANDLRHARWMNEALFAVTWGELIGQLLVPSRFDATRDEPITDLLARALDFAHDHVIGYVRGRGSLPVLRIGRQPYGLLPVTDMTRWALEPGERSELGQFVSLLGALRPFWSRAADETPGLSRSLADADEAGLALTVTLGLGPVPHPAGYWIRAVTGELETVVFSSENPEFVLAANGGAAPGDLPDGSISLVATAAQRSVYRALLATVPNVLGRARLVGMSMKEPQLLRIPVARTDPSRTKAPSPADYLLQLADSAFPSLLMVTPWEDPDPPLDLLYQLVHRSLRLANEQAGFAFLQASLQQGFKQVAVGMAAQSAEFASLALGGGPTIGSALTTPVSLIAEGAPASIAEMTLSSIVAEPDAIHHFELGEFIIQTPLTDLFVDAQAAVRALGNARLDDASYTRLVGETLSLCANRFDAWVTSVAMRRLEGLRAGGQEGLQIGSYGWLIDIKPNDLPAGPEAAAELKNWGAEGLAGAPLLRPERQVGFVHAPSLAQARTAAILRAGELSHESDDSSVARIDLTSGRVRIGEWILDAVRQGQPLGAVLGYRLERAMHERSTPDGTLNLHRVVAPLRERFPQRSAPPNEGDPEQVVPHQVVDGLLVWQAWKKGDLPALTNTADEATVFNTILTDLDGSVEAVADLLVAEGVQHLVQGDHVKAGATFAAIAAGGTPPLELDVLRTPRSGISIANRVILALAGAGAPGAPAGWDSSLPRARVAPHLEHWVEARLGQPSAWRVDVRRRVDDGQPPDPKLQKLTLASVGPICALDVIAELAAVDGSRSPLEERLLAAAKLADGVVSQPPPDTMAAGQQGWTQLVALAGAIGAVLSNARPLTLADLTAPSTDTDPRTGRIAPPALVPLGTLEAIGVALFHDPSQLAAIGPPGLVTTLRSALEALAEDLQADPPDPAKIQSDLSPFAEVGVTGAALRVSTEAAELVALGHSVAAIAGRRLDQAAKQKGRLDRLDPGDDASRLALLTRIVRDLLGQPVVLSPALQSAVDLPAGLALAAPPPADLEDWLARTGRVRPALADLDDLRIFCSVQPTPEPALQVAQLPYDPDDGWLAGPFSDVDVAANPSANPLRRSRVPKGPRAHLVMVTEPGASPANLAAGVVLDEFSEQVPSQSQLTGIAVHYDAPNAAAPQSILLAVHPCPSDPGVPWGWEMVESMLTDTLELARLRVVELDQLAITAIDEYLPATYVREGLDNVLALSAVLGRWIDANGVWNSTLLDANRTSRGGG